jgi:hypothetical protein
MPSLTLAQVSLDAATVLARMTIKQTDFEDMRKLFLETSDLQARTLLYYKMTTSLLDLAEDIDIYTKMMLLIPTLRKKEKEESAYRLASIHHGVIRNLFA